MLDHHQGIALGSELTQRAQQNLVIAWVQAYGGFIQHIAHALQIAAQLRRQADALRFAAAERGRAAIQREITQPHLQHKGQTRSDFRQQIAGNIGGAAGQMQATEKGVQIGHAHGGELGDGHFLASA